MGHSVESSSDSESFPSVRVVIVNFNGGEMTLQCLDSVMASNWPEDRLEVILINNSPDDEAIGVVLDGEQYRSVQVLQPHRNLGFAEGCNRGITHRGEFDLLALINNDAVVEPEWLRTLSAAMQNPPQPLMPARPFCHPEQLGGLRRVGAVSPKTLFADRYLLVQLSVEPLQDEGRRCYRGDEGLVVDTIRLDGVCVDERVVVDERFLTHGARQTDVLVKPVLAAGSDGALRVQVGASIGADPRRIELCLRSPVGLRVSVATNCEALTLVVGPEPVWVRLDVGAAPVDVVNNAGSELYLNGFAGDRGFMEIDDGRYDEPAEVFAWFGGAVLMSRAYLDDVGLFDKRLFLYYEDIDLAWRGRLRGWSYLYSPETTVRHVHGAAAGPTSQVFGFYNARNRLVVLVKNAPSRTVLRVIAEEVYRLFRDSARRVMSRPVLSYDSDLRHRWFVLGAFIVQFPAALIARFTQRVRISRREVLKWQIDKWAT